MNQINQAVILAAGMGSRLKSYTEHKPKALASVAGDPAIVRVIRELVAAGIHDIAINLHHLGDQIKDTLGNGNALNARLYYSEETHLLNSGGGVRTAMDLLPADDGLIVYNTDIMSDINFDKLSELCPDQGCSLALVENPCHNPSGDFSIEDGHITTKGTQTYTFSGVSAWSKQKLLTYADNTEFSLVEPIHSSLAEGQCTGFIHQGHWFDIGRPHDLVQAGRHYRKHAL